MNHLLGHHCRFKQPVNGQNREFSDNSNQQFFSMNGPDSLKTSVGAMVVIAIVITFAPAGRGAMAYLPSVGPAPLRFEPLADPGAVAAENQGRKWRRFDEHEAASHPVRQPDGA